MHFHIFENLQLEGSYVGDLTVFIFSCSISVISTQPVSFSLLTHSSLSSSLQLIPSRVFFISVIFLSSVWFFFMSSSSLYSFHCVHSIFSWGLWAFLWLLLWILCWVDFVFLLHLVLLRFYLVPLLETYPSIDSFYLIHCLYFYVVGRLVPFSSFGELSFYRRRVSQQCMPL